MMVSCCLLVAILILVGPALPHSAQIAQQFCGDRNHRIVYGHRTPGDRLLYASVKYVIPNRGKLFDWRTENDNIITYMEIMDVQTGGLNGCAMLLWGGPGHKKVTLQLLAEHGGSRQQRVLIYGGIVRVGDHSVDISIEIGDISDGDVDISVEYEYNSYEYGDISAGYEYISPGYDDVSVGYTEYGNIFARHGTGQNDVTMLTQITPRSYPYKEHKDVERPVQRVHFKETANNKPEMKPLPKPTSDFTNRLPPNTLITSASLKLNSVKEETCQEEVNEQEEEFIISPN